MIAPSVPSNLGPIHEKGKKMKQKLNDDLEESNPSVMQYSIA